MTPSHSDTSCALLPCCNRPFLGSDLGEFFVGCEAPAMIRDDQEDFNDPTLDTLQMLLMANTSQTYLTSLTSEGQQTVNCLLKKRLLAETVETPLSVDSKEKEEFKSSSPQVVAD
ncbi:hypothetical protein Nepgr_001037 [Nepenthes gracilis]|uniref:Uncharacterized protein n=1 Tax=Nepenthes gracilis TaxID=150966 RepID=A0AAD3P6C4_NEPGR|nr:hypothetical protein Nepgr_001037 [Nepenthes gracilis]